MSVVCGCIFFFKQKTAYEMRISDWSSDVCSSDLQGAAPTPRHAEQGRRMGTDPAVPLAEEVGPTVAQGEAAAQVLSDGGPDEALHGRRPEALVVAAVRQHRDAQGRRPEPEVVGGQQGLHTDPVVRGR